MKTYFFILTAVAALVVVAGCGKGKDVHGNNDAAQPVELTAQGELAQPGQAGTIAALPFSGSDVKEHVVLDYGNRTVRAVPDVSFSHPELMKDKKNCFVVISKKDFYLYVYESQGTDTVMLARYDCALSLKKGQKTAEGDMCTPHCSMQQPFSVSQIAPASSWTHDFGDGRGAIKSYGDYFLRLVTPGHSGIGIHGSTGNRESVPGRASEGCIRLKDEDIKDLAQHYATVGMRVVIKGETVDDYPFEIHAMTRQKIARKRHFDPRTTLTNAQIEQARPEQGRR